MRTRFTATLLAALSLTACGHHPPLRYVATERHYHHAPRQPYFAESRTRRSGGFHDMDPYLVRDLYYGGYQRGPLEGAQMRRAMERADVMYGHGCYPGWC